MKVFVTGVAGQLGFDCMQELQKRNYECIGSDIKEKDGNFEKYVSLDITNKDDVQKVILDINPDVIIHCAAWTAVDMAEDDDKADLVKKVNVDGTRNLALAAKKTNAKMVYFSTDYVFNGKGEKPWEPDSKDFAPLNYYGKTKLEGEKEVSKILSQFFIIRTAWVFGKNGNNFVKTMINVAKNHDEVRVVNDQIGTPTYTPDLSKIVIDMIETDKYGFYHITNSGGYISWYDFTKEIYNISGINTKVIPVTTDEYGESKAKRPFNSRLDKSKLEKNGFEPLPNWKDALKNYINNL